MDVYQLLGEMAPSCPYSILLLFSNKHSATYLIRERDEFGEFPNIYAKVYFQNESRTPTVIILSDSGTGLNTVNEKPSDPPGRNVNDSRREQATHWNIASFLSATINPSHASPYIVLTTHCHYDHICGIQHLLEAKVDIKILSSSHDISYVTPWQNLQKHSLCELVGLKAPLYDASWIDDVQRVTFKGNGATQSKESSLVVIHTPGHTPDSLSWYDYDSNTLCVGDMFYEKESDETRSGSRGQWSREPPQPVIFTQDSNIIEWNATMHRLLDFVRSENRRLGTENATSANTGYRQDGQGTALSYIETCLADGDWSLVQSIPARRRVVLCAAHVTIATDAEFALLDMLAFMLRIQLDQVPKKQVDGNYGGSNVWLWDDCLQGESNAGMKSEASQSCQYSVRAPWSIIHKSSDQNREQKSSQVQMSIDDSPNADFRSMLRQMTAPGLNNGKKSYLKSNALSSVSHSSVMADRPASSTRSSARKG